MWPAIICGLIIYKLFKCFFYDDDVSDIEASDSTVLFTVADRFRFPLNLTIFLTSIFNLILQFSPSRFNFTVAEFMNRISFSICCRLQKIFGGKVFVGLRIPDADSASPQSIDLVLVTKRYFSFILVFLLLLQ